MIYVKEKCPVYQARLETSRTGSASLAILTPFLISPDKLDILVKTQVFFMSKNIITHSIFIADYSKALLLLLFTNIVLFVGFLFFHSVCTLLLLASWPS